MQPSLKMLWITGILLLMCCVGVSVHTGRSRGHRSRGHISWRFYTPRCCTKLDRVESRLKRLESFMEKYEDKPTKPVELKNILDAPPSLVGFLVTYKGPHLNPDSAINMPYTDVIMNEGDAYDDTTNVFTAPVAGLYAFHVNGLSGNAHGCLWLTRNQKDVVSGWAPDMYGTMHISAGLLLKKGDKVAVKVCAQSTINNDTGSSFSGYLVKEDVPQN